MNSSSPAELSPSSNPASAAADTYWEKIIASSSGRFLPANITLRCQGLSVSSFLTWFKSNASNATVSLAGHPEHYISTHGPILETVGEHPSFFTLHFTEEVDKCVTNLDRGKYPIVLSGCGILRSGTVMGYACHQFRDLNGKEEGEGLEAMFGAWIPADVGEEVRERHRMHLEVEWSNWMRAAYEDLHGKGK